MDYIEFRDNIKKVTSNRIHKITNSYGTKDGYTYFNTIKPKDKKYNVTLQTYLKVHRLINSILQDRLSNGEDIKLPEGLGSLELRKSDVTYKIVDGKLKTNLPIDWNSTMKLWYSDIESYENKTLVKLEEINIFKIYYNKMKYHFKNKYFYMFNPNRDLKLKIKDSVKNNNIDAFNLRKK